MSEKCIRCGSTEVDVVVKQPIPRGFKYTYKCLKCQQTWTKEKKSKV